MSAVEGSSSPVTGGSALVCPRVLDLREVTKPTHSHFVRSPIPVAPNLKQHEEGERHAAKERL